MIINLIATWIPALGIAFWGVLKLTGNPRVAEEISKLGVGRYLRLLGVMEIAFAALFVVPATKLFIDAEPGVFIRGRIRSLASSFPNQHRVVVRGLHFVQEDTPDEIGRAIASWLERI
jgi:hypothetical protein